MRIRYLISETSELIIKTIFCTNSKLIRSRNLHPGKAQQVIFINFDCLAPSLFLPYHTTCVNFKLPWILQLETPSFKLFLSREEEKRTQVFHTHKKPTNQLCRNASSPFLSEITYLNIKIMWPM